MFYKVIKLNYSELPLTVKCRPMHGDLHIKFKKKNYNTDRAT